MWGPFGDQSYDVMLVCKDETFVVKSFKGKKGFPEGFTSR